MSPYLIKDAHVDLAVMAWMLIPRAQSPFSVIDMVGNVWQWTDEYVDDHTRERHSAWWQLLPATRFHRGTFPRPITWQSALGSCS